MTFLKVTGLFVVVLTVQLTIFTKIRVVGVAPELMALIAAMAGLIAGSRKGSLIAFFVGLLWDVYLTTPLGLSAISFAISAYAVGSIEEGLVSNTRVQTVILVMAATAISLIQYAVWGGLVGHNDLLSSELPKIIVVASVINAILAVPATPLMQWILKQSESN